MKTTTKIKIWLAAVVLAVLAVCGFLWLMSSTNGYDQRYADCMRARDAYSFPSNAYDQASMECEKIAAPGWPIPVKITHEEHGDP
jgi:hypothetical protein